VLHAYTDVDRPPSMASPVTPYVYALAHAFIEDGKL
jgi:hypothetical protein